ncbi:NADPH--hemoprotein reductase [Malassezia vespertilionis]|uniref:NADPH--cytochrome P450 reductase n=1 Tax=Malassezia vespertilionis TaxID=2020962 RepID=A0A2N1JAE5_9BASI|nr:NADPH--hemoprotein reductase [Malassezia vespertilionis]PKI83517.1 Ncp1p [Malassezia vespertilionis]WFD07247.1 NADPH--hemoprotein reductase [Malassezia vespertilionis]
MPGILTIVLAAVIGLVSVYFLQGLLISSKKEEEVQPENDEDDFIQRLVQQKRRIVVFYGSQTGTAEGFAIHIAREAKERYGVSSLVLDFENEEMEKLDQLPDDCVAVFVMATYGEGEPTDNAVQFMDFLQSSDVAFSNGDNLSNVNYVALGLGNKTYELYNETIKQLDSRLRELGANRVGEVGMGDDDTNIDEDYLAWKDPMFEALAAHMGLEEGATGEISDYAVTELEEYNPKAVFEGEHHPRALNSVKGGHDAKNPFAALVTEARELFVDGTADRSCVHMEFDISDSGVTYQHGDHVAVWPVNAEPQVERILAVLGLSSKRHQPISIKSLDPAIAKVPFPQPTTYEAIFRYYLDVSGLASRQSLAAFVHHAPNEAAHEKLQQLSKDKDLFMSTVAAQGLRIGEVLQMVAGDSMLSQDVASSTPWQVSFDRVISSLPRLAPRYYSISSSPKLFPNKIDITTVALRFQNEQGSDLYGLASNFVSALKMKQNNEAPQLGDPRYGTPIYHLDGPRRKYVDQEKYRVPISVRRSTFRLPTSTKVPIIMVGPGTGVAPFRSFVQDRVGTAIKTKEKLGPDALRDWADITLYYGCRRNNEDFLYSDEWPDYQKQLDDKLKLRVSFSREVFKEDGSKKYVQDLIWEDRAGIADAMLNKNGYFYICGEGKGMAQDVEAVLERILVESKGIDAQDGHAELKKLKERGRLLLDVWS